MIKFKIKKNIKAMCCKIVLPENRNKRMSQVMHKKIYWVMHQILNHQLVRSKAQNPQISQKKLPPK